MPTINTMRKTAKAAGKNEIMRGTSNLAVLRSSDVAFINANRVSTNHISPADGSEISKRIIKYTICLIRNLCVVLIMEKVGI